MEKVEIREYPKIDGIYKHYKGGLYQVITLAECKETNKHVVVYKSLLFGSIYTRPLNEWFEELIINDTEFLTISRFREYENI